MAIIRPPLKTYNNVAVTSEVVVLIGFVQYAMRSKDSTGIFILILENEPKKRKRSKRKLINRCSALQGKKKDKNPEQRKKDLLV